MTRHTHHVKDVSHQTPILEWFDGHWVLWLNYNKDRTAGTYLALLDEGQIVSMTIDEDGVLRNSVELVHPVSESHTPTLTEKKETEDV